MTISYIIHYRDKNLWEWQTRLIKEDFLRTHSTSVTEDTYSLKTPLQFLITSQVVERIKRRYKPDREIGGILLAEPVKIDGSKTLIIDHVRFFRNVSDDPRKYQARGNQLQAMNRCLMGTKSNVRYFPIWFHSHPRKSKNLPELIMTFFEMGTSPEDKRVATRKITYSRNSKYLTFAFPSALIMVTYEDKLFTGVYGGFIAPDDFRVYVQKLLEKSKRDLVNWGSKGESILQKIVGILGGLGVGFVGAVNHPAFRALAIQIAIMRKELDADPDYFATTENQDLKITIPELS